MEHIITERLDGKTVFDVIRRELKLSRRLLIRLKTTDGGITLNGEHVNVRAVVKAGDVLTLEVEDKTDDMNTAIEPVALDFGVVHEEDGFIVVSKPCGMVTHPSHNHQGDSLANALGYYYQKRGVPFVFRPVNRLDRDTSGLVLIAKDQATASRLSTQLQKGRFSKGYTALLCGSLEPSEGEITGYVRRLGEMIVKRYLDSEGIESDYSLTRYRTLESNGEFSLVYAEPITGRTHQLRVHFSAQGCPILGDTLYGDDVPNDYIARQALHASYLAFDHPSTGERLEFFDDLPEDFRMAREKLFR